MKKKWLGFRIAAGVCAALGWWGLLYPELTLTPDTVAVCAEDEEGCPGAREWSFDGDFYLDLLSAGRERITFRSRLLTDLNTFWEMFHDKFNEQ